VKIISCFSQKGGVGKTTATINISAAFGLMLWHGTQPGQEPGRILIVDLDQQANTDITLSGGFFGQREKRNMGPYDNIAGLLMLDTQRSIFEIISNANIPVNSRNVDFIPSNREKMLQVEPTLQSDPANGLFRLQEVLEPVGQAYEYVFIDNPPGVSHLSVNSLVASTHVILPIQLEAASVFGLADSLKAIKSIQQKYNRDLQVAGILPTMCNFRGAGQQEFYDGLCRQYGDLMLPPIYQRAEISDAFTAGLDIFSYKPARQAATMVSSSASTQEYAEVAEELRRRLDN
jgi:chromosome partitioning protein